MSERVKAVNPLIVLLFRLLATSGLPTLWMLAALSRFFYAHAQVHSNRNSSLMPIQACRVCLGASVVKVWDDDQLHQLYLDYRSASYNLDRSKFQPSYSLVARHVGVNKREFASRTQLMDDFLLDIDISGVRTVLDYGGSGLYRFSKFQNLSIQTFDIGTSGTGHAVDLNEDTLPSFDFIQCTHVLEHVDDLEQTVSRVRSLLTLQGMVFVEVPLDVAESTLQEWAEGKVNKIVKVTEHVQFFSRESLIQLFTQNGFSLVKYKLTNTHFGWHENLVHQACFARTGATNSVL